VLEEDVIVSSTPLPSCLSEERACEGARVCRYRCIGLVTNSGPLHRFAVGLATEHRSAMVVTRARESLASRGDAHVHWVGILWSIESKAFSACLEIGFGARCLFQLWCEELGSLDCCGNRARCDELPVA